ncbi:LIM domain-containing protein [Sporobolomyces salmoneus]|uniref:LIM domain-containing protein n=1 Tax=Sporobolomyces salmoneus TaxID=183962 RepID=UPI00317D18D5
MYTEYQRDYHGRQAPYPPNPHFAPPHRSPQLPPSPSFPSSSNYQYHPQQQYPRVPSPQQPPYARNPPHPHYSPTLDPPPPPADAIKCSSCSSWVHLNDLGDHVCSTSSRSPNPGPRGRNEESFARDLRVDVQAAGNKAYGPNATLRSPMYPGHLEPTPPHTPGSSLSRPTSPALSSHSVSSNSSASSSAVSTGSSSRMPFFERYNKLVGSGNSNGGGNGNMAGVGMRNLDMPSRSPGTPPGFPLSASPSSGAVHHQRDRSPSPNPNSFAFHSSNSKPLQQQQQHSSLSEQMNNSSRYQTRPPPTQPQRSQTSYDDRDQRVEARQNLRAPSPIRSSSPSRGIPPPERPLGPQRAHTSPSLAASETFHKPPSSPAPLPSNLARSPSNSSSIHSIESAYIAYDKRDTLKPSPSNPTMTRSPSTRSNASQGGNGSISSLDALEDLLLMAREEAEDDEAEEGKQALLDEFLAPSRVKDRSVSAEERRRKEEDDVSSTPRAPTSRIPTSKSVPSLTPFSNPSSSSSPSFRAGPLTPSGSSPNLSSTLRGVPTSFDCTTCRTRLKPSQIQKAGDGQLFCRECYAERYLPKCRKCEKAIEGGAVTSSDGKVVGKYHPACFSCFSCSKSFPSGDFYVFDGKPYCQYDYHSLNGSLCTNKSCGTPIEGPCVSLVGEDNGAGGRYHPDCFVCSISTCSVPLLEHHFVVDRLPYCERHSSGNVPLPRSYGQGSSSNSASTSRAKKRQTIITKR